MHKAVRIAFISAFLFSLISGATMSIADNLSTVPTSAPIDTDSAGRLGDVATHAVIRLLCLESNTVGTGFLHKSGNLITADHVVRGCAKPTMVLANGTLSPVTTIATDQDHDLALVKPSTPLTAKPLEISGTDDIKIGAQVSTWGFPGGYNGLSPMLSVGYLAGIDAYKTDSGAIIQKWVVNAAFNGGNSGGPLIHIESGTVFGVVSSKLAPISPDANAILHLLETTNSGIGYTFKNPDGTSNTIMEAKLVGMVLNELRNQVQLVIGQAVLRNDLITFLKANKIDP
jgi:S1-C subfamily serine protease